MFAKHARRRFGYVILIGIAALAASAAGSRTSAQDRGAGEPSLDELFEQALAAVAGVRDPSNRLFIAQRLGEADVNHGGRRLEARLIPLLEPALEEVPADRQAGGMAYAAATLAVYGRTSELLAVMRNLNDAWNYGAKVLLILAQKGDVATAVILAERESKPDRRFQALIHIVHGLAESGERQEARKIFDQAQSIYGALSQIWRNSYAGDYLAALAHFDLDQAERLALGIQRERDRDQALLAITRVVAKSDPQRTLEMALKIQYQAYRGYALSSVIRATARHPHRQKIYQRALALVDPLGRAYAYRAAARDALTKGDLARARQELDRLDAVLPTLSEKDRARVADRVVTRLALELLSGDANRVFEKMEGLTYGDGLSESAAVWILSNALRMNGHYDLGRRVAETIQGTTNHASYFIATIKARFE